MTRRLGLFAGLTVALVVMGPTSIKAHPGSTTAVVISTAAGTFDVAVHTNAAALVTKLEATAGAPLQPEITAPQQLAARLTQLGPLLLEGMDLRIDGTRARLDLSGVTVDEVGQAVIRLTTAAPERSRAFTWSTSLVYGAYPLSLRDAANRESVVWLQGRASSAALPFAAARASTPAVLWRGTSLGFTHILPHGLDHILFVLGLFLLSGGLRALLWQVTAFTLAHSVTLGLSLYGLVSMPSTVVEPLIALSVAYVGVENLLTSRLRPWRVAVVFAFGLLHGLGFAEAISGLNLARTDLVATLVSFNVGVELGQLAVIGGAYGVFRVLSGTGHAAWRLPIARFGSAAVGAMGLLWTFERIWS